ncbi:endonuclease domain-containing protein [Cupriavidus sp. CP313]
MRLTLKELRRLSPQTADRVERDIEKRAGDREGRVKASAERGHSVGGEGSYLEAAFEQQLRATFGREPHPAFRWCTEYRFALPRLYRFDFAWPNLLIAVELEGGIWNGGRHTQARGFIEDARKYNLAAEMGWTVLRYPGTLVNSGEAVSQTEQMLRTALRKLQDDPKP